ncbi:MAG: PIN domain-containing protein [Deferrisomatales bacterium]|nr:PIN domain-containing protein [Deferrisomatales bacterium]
MTKARDAVAELFLDAAFAIALAVKDDRHHARALALADQIQRQGQHLVTTRAVALEVGNALAKVRYRQAAVALLTALERDPNVEVIPCSEPLYERALSLYQSRPDKEWGITDCLSFVVMGDRGIGASARP